MPDAKPIFPVRFGFPRGAGPARLGRSFLGYLAGRLNIGLRIGGKRCCTWKGQANLPAPKIRERKVRPRAYAAKIQPKF